MKKVVAIGFVGLFLVSMLASCGTQRVHCDAYGGRTVSK